LCFNIDAACGSHIGKVRLNNLDNFLFDGKCMRLEDDREARAFRCSMKTSSPSCFAVFDGMGGGENGVSAAYIAAKTLMVSRPFNKNPRQFLKDTCKSMQKAVCLESIRIGNHRMGTTAAILFPYMDKLYICNIGDSKVFLIRKGKIKQLSCDHVYRLPERASVKRHKPVLSQYLGIFEDEALIQPYLVEENCMQGDIIVLCTDGITNMVSDMDILEYINMDNCVDSCVEKLINKALINGGKDNITLIVASVGESIGGQKYV